MTLLRRTLRAVTPYGLVEVWRKHSVNGARRLGSGKNLSQAGRPAFHSERHQRIAACETLRQSTSIHGDNPEEVIAFLAARGIDEQQVREGSIPVASLEYLRRVVHDVFATRGPVSALHVGNFVGVSVAFVATVLKELDPSSLVVSIDPNVAHRGVLNPQAHVSALLTACGVQRNTVMIAGYSGEKNISNDGVSFAGYHPEREFLNEYACEGTLENLTKLHCRGFDLAMLDGNHDASYLVAELRLVVPLLGSGALVILDDVDESWSEIRDVFNRLEETGLRQLSTDGRIGIARLDKVPA